MNKDDVDVIIGLVVCILAVPLAIECWVGWLKDKGFLKWK